MDYANENEISGGEPALSHEFPWMVRIYGQGCVTGLCGGALISPRLVLTAFHCTRYTPISFDKPCDHSDEERVAVLGNPDMRDISTRVEIPVIKSLIPVSIILVAFMCEGLIHEFQFEFL